MIIRTIEVYIKTALSYICYELKITIYIRLHLTLFPFICFGSISLQIIRALKSLLLSGQSIGKITNMIFQNRSDGKKTKTYESCTGL